MEPKVICKGAKMREMIGKRNGMLEVKEVYSVRVMNSKGKKRSQYFYSCECDCGKMKDVRQSNFWKTFSCGCTSLCKGVTYHSKYGRYSARIIKKFGKKTEEYNLGQFADMNVAIKVRKEAEKHISDKEEMDRWFKEERPEFIRDLIPDYIFRDRNKKDMKYILKKETSSCIYFRVTFSFEGKAFYIGTFKELDVAKKVRDEALKHMGSVEQMQQWYEDGRKKYILSVCPNYHFKDKNKEMEYITAIGNMNGYKVSIAIKGVKFYIGTFKDLDVAKKMRDEALKHMGSVEQMQQWYEDGRKKCILSLIPDYRFDK